MPESRRYLFHPLERRGVIVGLQGSQVAALAGGVLAALVAVSALPGGGGVAAALLMVGLSVGVACWPVAGRPPAAWLPVATGWLYRRHQGPRRSAVGDARSRPAGGRNTQTTPAGIELLDAPVVPGDRPMGVIRDRRAGTWAAVLAVSGRSLSLLEPLDQDRRLAAWGAILAGLARPGTHIHRVQWVEASVAGDADELVGYLNEAGTVATDGRVQAATRSYAALVAEAGPASQEHHVWVVLSVRPRRARRAAARATEGGPAGGRGARSAPVDLLRREMRLLQGHLRAAEVVATDPCDRARLSAVLRAGAEIGDGGRRLRRVASTGRDCACWPMATDEAWSALRVDGSWHATYWVAEWPRFEVGSDFLAPLLLTGGQRRVGLTMAPVPPDRAARQVESARTADAADEELRRRAGFLSTARRQRQAEGVLQRETELADGHAEYRFSGYVTVSGADRAQLDSACAEIEQAAHQAHLELRRLYGQQEEAYTWTLPLGRGLR